MKHDFLIAEDIAQLLRIDRQRVYELARTRQIPAIRLGKRQYRFSAGAIREFLAAGGTDVKDQNSHKKKNLYKK